MYCSTCNLEFHSRRGFKRHRKRNRTHHVFDQPQTCSQPDREPKASRGEIARSLTESMTPQNGRVGSNPDKVSFYRTWPRGTLDWNVMVNISSLTFHSYLWIYWNKEDGTFWWVPGAKWEQVPDMDIENEEFAIYNEREQAAELNLSAKEFTRLLEQLGKLNWKKELRLMR